MHSFRRNPLPKARRKGPGGEGSIKERKVSFASDRLSELANGSAKTWAIGYQDKCWWSRVALPALHSFSAPGEPLRLIEQSVGKDDPDPTAISCYGLYMPHLNQTWIRFVEGRPVSGITIQFITCYLPTKSPWLNVMETKWIHGRRKVVEADRLLDAHEMAVRVCAAFGCPHYKHLSITENVA